MAAELLKQEYLKRYLEDNDKDKKCKKKVKSTKSVIPRIKILDNDIGIKSINFGTKEEIEEDETPVVAEVIDERPVEVKLKEIYESSRWKKLGPSKTLSTNFQRPSKTLSGLKAGLQNTTLREENKEFREREKMQIRQLDAELSGRNAGTVVRDRQTGLKRDIDQEMRLKEREERKKSEQQQKYSEWGKGVEQTENRKSKLTEDLYEMSKPLARYCDDEDLEERLKSEIRDDDPMAQYMHKKRQKAVVSAYPMYSGPPPPPNRFGIPPGYRWDGVDRSNGFENKYFEQKSNKHAGEEEAYLWSIQDM